MENQGTSNPFIFFSPGIVLANKDRDINSDLVDIHKFFAPIDNLFGDYESRKKYGLERKLFRKLYSKSRHGERRTDEDILESIKPEEWKNYFIKENRIDPEKSIIKIEEGDEEFKVLEEETIILTRNDFEKNKGTLLVIFLIYESSKKDMVIDFDFKKASELRKNYETIFHTYIDSVEKISDKQPTGDKISQIFVIDPVKINEIISKCESNFNFELEKLNINRVNKGEILEAIIKIKKALYKLMANPQGSVWRITDTNVYELFHDSEIKIDIERYKNDMGKKGKPIAEVFYTEFENIKSQAIKSPTDGLLHLYLADQFCSRKVKMKKIEKFNFIRVRIGWHDNRYVLYLHPYESESNGPIRFPPQG